MFRNKLINLSVLLLLMVSHWPNLVVAAVQMNFRDADIEAVVDSIAEITGHTFIMDPRIKGNMTIISTQPVENELLYEIFLSALQVHGFQAVNDGAAIRIVPVASALKIPHSVVGGELVTEVLFLNYIKAADAMPLLRPLLSTSAHIAVHPSTNILIVSDTKSQLNRIKTVLADIDTLNQKGYDIIELTHTTASDIVDIATKMGLFSGTSKVVEDVKANRIIISGPSAVRAELRRLIAKLDLTSDEKGNIDVINLNYVEADKLQPVLDNLLKAKLLNQDNNKGLAAGEVNYSIQANSENNALIVGAPPDMTKAIRLLVEKLDQPREQVLIEAVIANVSEQFKRDLEVNLLAKVGSAVFISDFSGLLTTLVAGQDDSSIANGIVGSSTAFVGSSDEITSENGLSALIQAIQSDANNNVLSTPSILTLDNEEASISVGREIPIETGSFSNTSNGISDPFTTISRQEIGTILKVKPHINKGDSIRLAIVQEVSGIDPNTQISGGVTTTKKKIETNVMVKDGEFLVLGGLVDQQFKDVEQRVPLLGDIPLVGRLFRSSKRDSDNSVLMVFIRPTIIRTEGKAKILSQEKYRILRDYQAEFINDNDYKEWIDKLPAVDPFELQRQKSGN